MRISRALALAGIDSRRKCEIHVRNGAVMVNGEVVQDLGRQVDPENDAITFRGRLLHFNKMVYYILNKPTGYTTTAHDPHAKHTVYELLPRHLVQGSRQPKSTHTRVFPVGRLDKESTGLLLFTNDGELANKLMHPRYGIHKCYEVRLDRAFEMQDKQTLLEGVSLEDGMAKAEKVHVLSRRILRLVLREGRKREIRRMFEELGYEVIDLIRISFGHLKLAGLSSGSGRFLTPHEIADLKKSVS